MTVLWAWCGAPTSQGATIVASVNGATSEARLAIADNPNLFMPSLSDPETPDGGIVRFTATGLEPNRVYYWGISEHGVIDHTKRGKFKTAPAEGEPADLRIVLASCAGASSGEYIHVTGVSNSPVFEEIRRLDPDWFGHVGDLFYKNIATDNVGLFRSAYDDLLSAPLQARLYREVASTFMWDDHDYGPNNSDGTHPGKHAAAQAYRERVPHYPLVEGTGSIYHSFQHGRVLFIASDTRFNRTPNSEPDDASKTMLGATQKAWMENILATSDAELFVWLNPTPWLGNASDTWNGFTTERQELAEMFGDLGWMDRMVCINGDLHALAMDSGGGNQARTGATFPVYLWGSLDSLLADQPGNPTHQYDMGPTRPGGWQYGVLDVEDNGHYLEITGTGYTQRGLWRQHRWQTPYRAPVIPSEGPRAVDWMGCDLVSGRIIAELPDLSGSLSKVIGAHTTSSLTCPIPLGGPAAATSQVYAATEPGRTMIVAVLDGTPAWGGIVLAREGGTGGELTLGTVSIEGYLERRFVETHQFEQQDQTSGIAATLGLDANVEGIGLVIDAPPSGVLRDRTYAAEDDKTIYSALRELMGTRGGPEWTIDLGWTDATKSAVAKILRVHPRIGRDRPEAVFDSRSTSEISYTYTEDYGSDRGANHVIAVSSGEGDTRPQSAPARDSDLFAAGWPRWERRFTPSTSIIDTATLDDHARAELQLAGRGARIWRLTARSDERPRLGWDWDIGDDVSWRVTGHRHAPYIHEQPRTYGNAVLEQLPSILLWYRLDEDPLSDTAFNSAAGGGHHGVVSGDQMPGADPLVSEGNAYRFDQHRGDHVTIPDGSVAINGQTALTVALWFNATNPAENDFLIDSTNSSVIGGLSIRKGSTDNLFINLQLDTGRNLVSTSAGTVPAGATHFVVVTWRSGRNIRCWIDGQQVNLTVNSGTLNPLGHTVSTNPELLLGKWRASSTAANFLHGRLDEVTLAATYVEAVQVGRLWAARLRNHAHLDVDDGYLANGRVIGWNWEPVAGTVEPVLLEPGEQLGDEPPTEPEDEEIDEGEGF